MPDQQNSANQTSNQEKVSLAVDFLLPGTVIGSDVYDKKGRKILDAKTPFTADIIASLKNKRIERIFYYQSPENGGNAKEGNDASKQTEQARLLNRISAFARQVSGEIENYIRNEEFIQTTGVHQLMDILMKYASGFDTIPGFLLAAKNRQDHFADHALNTSLLSIIIARKHRFENSLIKQIGIGAFLHDIGKFRFSRDLFLKEEGYTQEEIEEIKKHATYGFELIKLNGQLSSIVRKIILLHHEAVDGSGYPLALKEKDVGYYPYIVSLANVFDNLTTNKSYREAYPLRDTLNMLIQSSGKKFPAYLVQLFIKTISRDKSAESPYSTGDFVLLNTQEIAQITGINSRNPHAPRIRIIKNHKGHNQDPPQPLDLTASTKRHIEKKLGEELQRQLLLRYPLEKK